jgi:hypothetical protein
MFLEHESVGIVRERISQEVNYEINNGLISKVEPENE